MSKFSNNAPSASRHHADWLSLVEVSGPFVSLPVMLRVFPQGLEPRDPAQAKALRAAYEEWHDTPSAPGKQRAWVFHVLTAVLGYPSNQITEGQTIPAGMEANMPEMGENLRPDFALISPSGSDIAGQAQLLIASYPAEQKLDRPVIGKHWKATPATRMMELLHGANVPLGLVTNGEQWMLVYAPRGEITGYASWFCTLWLDEPITLRAFHSLLGVRRFFGVAADSALLALLKESASDQQEVTDQLGYQVREAVEVLVQSFDAIDKDSNRILLKGVSPNAQYEAALTIMMRLVFLFFAEERGLLHLGKPLYDNNYAVSTLQEQLQEVADRYGEEVLERRTDAWARLLASFRAVHGGIKHQDLLMQAYGGSLFDPDRYPFLEGRAAGSGWRSTPAEPLVVNNRVVLHLLNSLQRLRIKVGSGGTAETRRISFRALGVEQIGHVYEGLLDHTGVRANETVLGIKGSRNKEPEIPLTKLELLQEQGQDKLINFLKEETGRSLSALRKILDGGGLLDEHKLLVACGHDESLLTRIRPFASLIREDSFERPLVVLDGSVYVTAGTTRRSTGTHYTPPSLTETIVQHTLEALVYEGPTEGVPREQWKLKSPKAILDLKVCDMAMGSGAFLVQACRYLAERLTEAWENEEKQHPGQVLITPDGKFSEGAPSERLVPADANERVAVARRVVADRCLYGVDINGMAVEMAKLSLWLITVDANRPFTFLDHAFKVGDSLLGVTSLGQLENFSLQPGGGKQHAFGTLDLLRHIDEAKVKRNALESMPSDTPQQIAAKTALYAEAEAAVAKLNAAADVLVSVELMGLKGKAYDHERERSADHIVSFWNSELSEIKNYGKRRLEGRQCLHWALSFPEINERGGFDAFVGNPPFVGGFLIGLSYGSDYRTFIGASIANGKKGSADLCAFFFLRATAMLNQKGMIGLVATNTISQGDTCDVGLTQLTQHGVKIVRAVSSQKWPGTASLEVAHVWFCKSNWRGPVTLDDKCVVEITPQLKEAGLVRGKPFRLSSNIGKAFKGTTTGCVGFVISPEERAALISADLKNADVIRPFLSGEDFNQRPDQSPSRFVIDFQDWEIEQAEQYPMCLQILLERVKPHRDAQKGQIHESAYWRFSDKRVEGYRSISNFTRVMFHSFTSKYICFAFVPAGIIYSAPHAVIGLERWRDFAVLQSSFHQIWAVTHCSTMETRIRYAPSDLFDTFAQPFEDLQDTEILNSVGESYHTLRANLMTRYSFGLTDIYNQFHNTEEIRGDISELRQLHVEMDQAVAAAYGWQDLNLDYGFHETKQGIRYTISEAASREVLDRLLALNHLRHTEEEAAKAALPVSTIAKRAPKKIISLTPGLFD